MMDFSKFIELSYWVSPRATTFHWFQPIMILFIVIIVIGIVINFFVKKKIGDKLLLKFFKSIPKGLYIFGFLGVMFTFFRYQEIRFLSMRLWFLLLLIFFIGWIGFYIFQFKVLYPKVDCEYKSKQLEDKYKPKKGDKKRKKKKR